MMNTVPFEHEPGRIGVITGKTEKYGTVRIGEITPPDDSPTEVHVSEGVGRTDN